MVYTAWPLFRRANLYSVDVAAEPGRVDQVRAPPAAAAVLRPVDVDDGPAARRQVDDLLLDVGRRRSRRSHSTLVQFATPRNVLKKKLFDLAQSKS